MTTTQIQQSWSGFRTAVNADVILKPSLFTQEKGAIPSDANVRYWRLERSIRPNQPRTIIGQFRSRASRCAVPSPIPSSFATVRHEAPECLKSAIWVSLTSARSRPSRLPFARALHSRLDPLLDQRALKLRHGADNLKHEPAGWCAEV